MQSDERKVPLTYQWVGDMLLNEFLESMAGGDEESRKTPALVFCFNRDMCWNVAEQVKGKKLIGADQQRQLVQELEQYDWSQGAGPKLRQLLLRGVGVHHAGVLPKYKRIVEELVPAQTAVADDLHRDARRPASICRPAASCCPSCSRARRATRR